MIGMLRPSSLQASNLWYAKGLPRWEQLGFGVLDTLLRFLLLPVAFAFGFVYNALPPPLNLLEVPVVLALNGVWLVCFGIVLGLSFVTERLSILRPVTFLLAIPFLLLGSVVNGFCPRGSPSDIEGISAREDLLATYPRTWSLSRDMRKPQQDAGK
jgi:hypothetical protein